MDLVERVLCLFGLSPGLDEVWSLPLSFLCLVIVPEDGVRAWIVVGYNRVRSFSIERKTTIDKRGLTDPRTISLQFDRSIRSQREHRLESMIGT